MLRVEYDLGGERCGKILRLHSDNLVMPDAIRRRCEELSKDLQGRELPKDLQGLLVQQWNPNADCFVPLELQLPPVMQGCNLGGSCWNYGDINFSQNSANINLPTLERCSEMDDDIIGDNTIASDPSEMPAEPRIDMRHLRKDRGEILSSLEAKAKRVLEDQY